MWHVIYSVAALSCCGGRDCRESLNSWRGGRGTGLIEKGRLASELCLESQYDAMGYYGSSSL